MGRLSKRDIRALKIGVLFVVGILVFSLAAPWLDRWLAANESVEINRKKLESLVMSPPQRAGLAEIVPVFEMPEEQEKQKFVFRDKVSEQLKKAGIKPEPLEYLSLARSPKGVDYKLLRLRCRSEKCKFDQVLDLLACLKENSYLAGIEEFKIECDPKNREEFKLDMTLSTFAKPGESL
jgi:hypothetical protein